MPGYRPVPAAAEWTECDCGAVVRRAAQARHDAHHDRLESAQAHAEAHVLVAVLEQAQAS